MIVLVLVPVKDQIGTLYFKYERKDQFFLEDLKIVKKIVDLAELNKNDTVLEVGAGEGNLTRIIAEKAGKVIGFKSNKILIYL